MNRFRTLPRLTPLRVAVLALVLAAIGGNVAAEVAQAQPTTYRAERQVLIRVWSVEALVLSGQNLDVAPTDLADAATVATSVDVLGPAAMTLEDSGLDAVDLDEDVTATPSQASDFVTISVLGSSRDEADERARVVANKFELVVQQKVLASVQQILAQSATGTADEPRTDIQLRAAGIAAVSPVQIYESKAPERAGVSTRTATAAGAVGGLALAALIAVLLAFGAPRLRRTGDVADALGVPALTWRADGAEAPTGGLAADLVRASSQGAVAICPARPQDTEVAERFASWLAQQEEAQATQIVSIDSPVEGLAASRPPAEAVVTSVLVTTLGTGTGTVLRASILLERWRAVDAVVLVG